MEHAASQKPLSPLLLALLTTFVMVLMAWQHNSTALIAKAIPFALLSYGLYFSLGSAPLLPRLQQWSEKSLPRALLLPLLLSVLLYLYVAFNGTNPLQGNSWQIPLLFCAPTLYYYLFAAREAITWRDIPGFFICILPYALHDYPFSSDLPYDGGGIETLYLTLAIIVTAYAVLVVRRLPAVGFTPYYSPQALWLVLKGWALFFVLVLLIGIPGGMIRWVGYAPFTPEMIITVLGLVMRTLLGTALPEELFFRALLLNLLLQWLVQSGRWRGTLYSALLLVVAAGVAGYTINDLAHWFPLLCAVVLWLATWKICRSQPDMAARYTALLFVGMLFGLLHYHTQSTIFVGLAMVAGWIYGYVYLKSGSLYYSALTHTLVNISPALFGFELIRH